MQVKATAPDGQTYNVTVPDDATDEQIQSYVASNSSATPAAPPGSEFTHPSEEVGPFENMAINMGRQSEKMTLGVKDLYYGIKNMVKTGQQYGPKRQAIADYNAEQNKIMAPLQEKRPITSTVGQAAYFGGIPGAAVATPARAVGTGAITGLADYESTPAMDASGALIGYGAGQAVGGMLEKLLNKKPLQSATRDAVKAGFELTPAQRLGNPKGLELMERGMESYPFTSGPMTQHKLNNQDLLNSQYALEIGLKNFKRGDKITGDKIFDAFTENSRGYKDVLKDRTVNADEAFAQQLTDIAQRDLEVPIKSPDIAKVVGDTWKMFKDGQVDGPAYQRMRSNLVQEMQNVKNSQTKSQPGYGNALGDMVYALDSLAERNIPGPELKQLNRQFKMLKTGTDGATPPLDIDTGDLSAPKMRNKLNKKDNYGYKMNQDKSDLYDTIRATGQNKASIGNSGTAERLSMQQLLLGGGAAAGGGYGAGSGDFITPALATIAPWLASKAYNSKANPMGRMNINMAPMAGIGAVAGIGADPENELLKMLLGEK